MALTIQGDKIMAKQIIKVESIDEAHNSIPKTAPYILELSYPLACFSLFAGADYVSTAANFITLLSGMNYPEGLPKLMRKAMEKQYAPRLRFYGSQPIEYRVGYSERKAFLIRNTGYTDQFSYAVKQLANKNRAVILFRHPQLDCFDLNGKLSTKQFNEPFEYLALEIKQNRLNCQAVVTDGAIVDLPMFCLLHDLIAALTSIQLGTFSVASFDSTSSTTVSGAMTQVAEMRSFLYRAENLTLGDIDKCVDIMILYMSSLENGEGLVGKNPFYVDNRLCLFSDLAEILRVQACREHKKDPVNGEF